MAYCLYDGKVDQESEFETKMYESLLDQVLSMQDSFARSMIHAYSLRKSWTFLTNIILKPESFEGHSTRSIGFGMDIPPGYWTSGGAFF